MKHSFEIWFIDFLFSEDNIAQ